MILVSSLQAKCNVKLGCALRKVWFIGCFMLCTVDDDMKDGMKNVDLTPDSNPIGRFYLEL